MSKIEIKSFDEQIRIAKISGELERAEERGEQRGIEKGEERGMEKLVLELLKKLTPVEISEYTSFSVEKILDIKNKYDPVLNIE